MTFHGFILTRCRLSFVCCAVLAFFMDPDHASHITIADPPTLAGTLQPQEFPI